MNGSGIIPEQHRLPQGEVCAKFIPETEEQMEACLASFNWRIFSGQLYKIMIKSEDNSRFSEDDPVDDDTGLVKGFIPNDAQADFIKSIWYRTVILKARQMGFTTCIAILALDKTLFTNDIRAAIIAHNKTDAEKIFRDKVKFAYDKLPEAIRSNMPLVKDSASELMFKHNNSAIQVATSARSGTVHFLHISEMGKIAKHFPGKAREIVTGSFPAVPADGVLLIESTSEGKGGEFHRIAEMARRNTKSGQVLKNKQWHLNFRPWWKAREYRVNPSGIEITPEEHAYFDLIEVTEDTDLSLAQRAWYVLERDEQFGGDDQMMWQEYPSKIDECWQQSTAGKYWAAQVNTALREKRITDFPINRHALVNTWWDIGSRDGTGIWLHQFIGGWNYFIGYIEGWEKPYEFFTDALRATGYNFNKMYLPHDAVYRKQSKTRLIRPIDDLQELAPDWDFHKIDRVHDKTFAINRVRKRFSNCIFHETACKAGIAHLENYQKRWNTVANHWSDEPLKNEATEAADALQQWAIGFDGERPASRGRKRKVTPGQAA